MHPKLKFLTNFNCDVRNVQFQKISTLTPQKGLEFPVGLRVLADQNIYSNVTRLTGISIGVYRCWGKIHSVGGLDIFLELHRLYFQIYPF